MITKKHDKTVSVYQLTEHFFVEVETAMVTTKNSIEPFYNLWLCYDRCRIKTSMIGVLKSDIGVGSKYETIEELIKQIVPVHLEDYYEDYLMGKSVFSQSQKEEIGRFIAETYWT